MDLLNDKNKELNPKISFTLSLMTILVLSCMPDETNSKIYWLESNAICVHWSDFGKKNFDTKAVRIVLKSRDSNVLKANEFHLSSALLGAEKIKLGRVEKLKQVGGEYFLVLFIRSKELYDLFPERKKSNKDNCYQIELANILGQGQITMKKEGATILIGKAENHTLSVGPR